jgi:hypothetical protein
MTTDADAGAEGAAVPFGGTLTFKRFLQLQKALRPRWAYPMIVAACVYFVWSAGSPDIPWYAPASLVTTVPVAGAMLFLIWGATRFTYRRRWRQMIALHGALSGTVGAAGVRWKTGLSESFFSWDRIVKARDVGDLLLLSYGPRCALYFPREFFADEAAWDAFKAIVRTRAT